jgi:signal transduction histidine kinase
LRLPDFLRTTAFRLSLAIAGFFTVSSVVVFAFVYWQTVDYASAEIDQEVMQTSHAIGGVRKGHVDRRLNRWLGEQDRIVRYGLLLDENGAKIAGNLDRMPDGIVYDGIARTLIIKGVDGDVDNHREMVRAVALQTADHLSLLVAEDTDEWEYFRDVLLRALGLGLVPILGLGCLGGALFGRSTLARMAAMDRSFDRIVHGDLSERLPLVRGRGQDEFDRLAVRVNIVLDDLQRLLLEAQSVGDTIAHDLRTPLTRMRARLENTKAKAQTADELRGVIEEATYWLDQTLGVITAVLRIGEIEHSRRRAAFRTFEAAALLREVYDLMQPLAEEKGVGFELDVENEVSVTGDRELILEAVINLVDNALKFTPKEGACLMSLSGTETGFVLRVRDNGPGIPEAERSAVMRRFFKGNAHRRTDGHGLGLALVAAVARLHDFELAIGDAGPGCVMELRGRHLGASSATVAVVREAAKV